MLKPQCSGVQHPVCRTLVWLEEICVYLQVGVQTCLLLNKENLSSVGGEDTCAVSGGRPSVAKAL